MAINHLPQGQHWAAEKKRTRWRYAAWMSAMVFPAAALLLWIVTAFLVKRAWLPPLGAALLGLVVPFVFLSWWLSRRWRRFDRVGLTPLALRALDRQRGVHSGGITASDFWQHRLKVEIGDRWPGWLVLACTFAVAVNTWQAWIPIVASLVGVNLIKTQQSLAPVVRIESMRVVSPLDGRVSDFSSSDGYVQVHEGSEISWLVRPLVPATHVTLFIGDDAFYLEQDSDVFAFQTIAAESVIYRFSAGRWGVEWLEHVPRRIEVMPDLPPEPFWLQQPPAESDGASILSYAWRAEDDRAVTAVVLEIAGNETYVFELFQSDGTRSTGHYRGQVDPSELPPGDELVFTLIAYDNDRYGGPNAGRSHPISVRMRSLEQSHEDWKLSLLSYLRRQTRFLAAVVNTAWSDVAWNRSAAERLDEASVLAATGRELAEIASSVEMRSRDAVDTLLKIARYYDRVKQNLGGPSQGQANVEEAVFLTDELIGHEEAAGLEHREDQMISRLEQLANQLDHASEAELDRMFNALLREMAEMAEAAQSKRPQLPTELLQQDAFKPEKQSERADLMEQIREAIRQGDRKKAKELMQQLIEQMKNARQQSQEAASMGSELRSGQQLAQQEQALNQLRQRQEHAAQQMQAAQQDLEAVGRELSQALDRQSRMAPQFSPEGEALREARQAMQNGDAQSARQAFERLGTRSGEQLNQMLNRLESVQARAEALQKTQDAIAKDTAELAQQMQASPNGSAVASEALEQAEQRMAAASQALKRKQAGEGANQGWQAADHLRRAAEAIRELRQKAEQDQRGQGRYAEYKPGSRGDHDGDSLKNDEQFETPEQNAERAGGREEVLQGFRRGLPEPGRSVNERYLDRLLH